MMFEDVFAYELKFIQNTFGLFTPLETITILAVYYPQQNPHLILNDNGKLELNERGNNKVIWNQDQIRCPGITCRQQLIEFWPFP